MYFFGLFLIYSVWEDVHNTNDFAFCVFLLHSGEQNSFLTDRETEMGCKFSSRIRYAPKAWYAKQIGGVRSCYEKCYLHFRVKKKAQRKANGLMPSCLFCFSVVKFLTAIFQTSRQWPEMIPPLPSNTKSSDGGASFIACRLTTPDWISLWISTAEVPRQTWTILLRGMRKCTPWVERLAII